MALKTEIAKRVVGYPFLMAVLTFALWAVSIRMPGTSFKDSAPPLSPSQDSLRMRLLRHVAKLAGEIGERNAIRYAALDSARTYLIRELAAMGYEVSELPYTIAGRTFVNLEVTVPGRTRARQIVVIGGHYDTVITPGADDNASGVAGILELARALRERQLDRNVRFVAFTNEEPPFFWTEDMGSLRYARAARARGDSIVAMLSLECIGYFSDDEESQKYPPVLGWFYPSKGNFIGFVGNVSSRGLVHETISSFRSHATIPSVGTAAPTQFPGIGWSDHWAFWKAGYPALMVTTTAPFRDPNYHTPSDLPEKLDYRRMTLVVDALVETIADIANKRE